MQTCEARPLRRLWGENKNNFDWVNLHKFNLWHQKMCDTENPWLPNSHKVGWGN